MRGFRSVTSLKTIQARILKKPFEPISDFRIFILIPETGAIMAVLEQKFLALDFDGVIVDSVGECMVTSFNAYAGFSGSGRRIQSPEDLDKSSTAAFKRMRNFIRFGKDFLFIWLAISRHLDISSQTEFDTFLETEKRLDSVFFDLFYRERDRSIQSQPDRWTALTPLYRGVQPLLQTWAARDHFAVISTRKKGYIRRILDFNGCSLPENRIHFATPERSKEAIVAGMLTKYRLAPKQFHFVDDQVDTLIKVRGTEVRVYLAEWGYCDENQLVRSGREGIPILSLEQFLLKFG